MSNLPSLEQQLQLPTSPSASNAGAQPAEEELIAKEILQSSTDDIMNRTRLLENEIKILKSEFQRLKHEEATMKEKIKDNKDKIKLNKQLPYLVGNVVEV